MELQAGETAWVVKDLSYKHGNLCLTSRIYMKFFKSQG